MAKPVYTEEALDRMARSAADMIIARLDGDKDGATAAERQARQIASNPRSRQR